MSDTTIHLSLPDGLPEPGAGTTHQLAVVTTVPGLTLYSEPLSEYYAAQLRATLEQRLRSQQPVMSFPQERTGPTRFNTQQAVTWKVIPAVPKGPQP